MEPLFFDHQQGAEEGHDSLHGERIIGWDRCFWVRNPEGQRIACSSKQHSPGVPLHCGGYSSMTIQQMNQLTCPGAPYADSPVSTACRQRHNKSRQLHEQQANAWRLNQPCCCAGWDPLILASEAGRTKWDECIRSDVASVPS